MVQKGKVSRQFRLLCLLQCQPHRDRVRSPGSISELRPQFCRTELKWRPFTETLLTLEANPGTATSADGSCCAGSKRECTSCSVSCNTRHLLRGEQYGVSLGAYTHFIYQCLRGRAGCHCWLPAAAERSWSSSVGCLRVPPPFCGDADRRAGSELF